MSNQDVVFITGANTGLGLEIVKSLCRSSKSYHIIVGTRTLSNGEHAVEAVKKEYPSATSTLEVMQADLASDESLEKAIEQIGKQYGHLDVLVNNAGASFDRDLASGKKTVRETWNATWDTNVSGTQVLTTLAIPLLLKSSNPRLLFVTSGTSALSETERRDNDIFKRLNANPPAGWPKPEEPLPISVYRSAKTGLNMMMREWSRLLGNDGVKTWCISPGLLATGLAGMGPEKMKEMGAIEPYIGADFTVSVIEGARDHDVGKAIRKDMVQPW